MVTGREVEMFAPPVVPASWRQLGILVCDGSTSMLDPVSVGETGGAGSKAQAVALAVGGLFDRMKVGSKKENFHFAQVDFTTAVTGTWGPSPLVEVDAFAEFDPTRNGTGGTRLAAGLDKAGQIAREFLAHDVDGLPASVVVLVLTDGECNTPPETVTTAQGLLSEPRITLACAYFATKGQPPAGLGLLQQICTQPATTWCKTVYDGESLREFFHRSMTNPATQPTGSGSGSRPR